MTSFFTSHAFYEPTMNVSINTSGCSFANSQSAMIHISFSFHLWLSGRYFIPLIWNCNNYNGYFSVTMHSTKSGCRSIDLSQAVESWVDMLAGVGLIVELVRSWLTCSFWLCIIWFPETNFVKCLEVLPSDAFKAFLCRSIINKTAFCWGEK